MKIKFIDVGRNNTNWESDCPAKSVEELDYGWLYSQVKKHGMVMSRELDFFVNKDGTGGSITAGFHTIGKFEIIN